VRRSRPRHPDALLSALPGVLPGALLCALLCVAAPRAAGAYGLFVSAQGQTSGPAARALVARTPTGLRLLIQGQYRGAADATVYWLVPVPNVTDLDATPARLSVTSSAPLDELEALSAPRLEGACGEAPSGEVRVEALPLRSGLATARRALALNAVKLSPPEGNPDGESDARRYLATLGVPLTPEVDALLSWSLDQNLMIALVEFEAGGLLDAAGAPVDPTLDLDLPLGGEPALRLPLRPLSVDLRGAPSDVALWVLGQERHRASFPTRELDFTPVRFRAPDATDYLPNLDIAAQGQQSQVFFTEFVGTVDPTTFADPALAALRSEVVGTKLTRLRARLLAAALRANADVVTLSAAPGPNYDRAHRVQGWACAPEGGAQGGDAGGAQGGVGGAQGGEGGAQGGAQGGVGGAQGGAQGGEGGDAGGAQGGAQGGTQGGAQGGAQGGDAGGAQGGAGGEGEARAARGGGDGCAQGGARPAAPPAPLAVALWALWALWARRTRGARGARESLRGVAAPAGRVTP